MKLLVSCIPAHEAPPVFTYGFVKGLVNNGVDVYVILADDIENRNEWETLLDSDHIFWARVYSLKKNLFSALFQYFVEYLQLFLKYRLIRFDAYIRTFPVRKDEIFKHAVRSSQIVNICHDPIPHSGVSKKRSKSTKKRIEKSDKVIVLTESFIPIVEKNFHKNSTDIIFMRHGLINYSNSEYNINRCFCLNKPIVFLFFGRYEPYKGIDILLKAFDEISKERSECELIVAGKGKLPDYKIKSKKVKVINRYIEDYEVDKIFREDNVVVVLPYKDATQSGIITIAYEYLVPVIASDTGGLREQLFDGEAGIMVPPNDVKALKKAMISIDNQFMYNKQVKAIQKYKKYLEWNNITYNFIKDLTKNEE